MGSGTGSWVSSEGVSLALGSGVRRVSGVARGEAFSLGFAFGSTGEGAAVSWVAISVSELGDGERRTRRRAAAIEAAAASALRTMKSRKGP
jgi:hypothetical protein